MTSYSYFKLFIYGLLLSVLDAAPLEEAVIKEDLKNELKVTRDTKGHERKLRIALIADLDQKSIEQGGASWISYLKEGDLYFHWDPSNDDTKIRIEWDDSAFQKIRSDIARAGRGMELSTLNIFSHKLLACDDRTGIIYDLQRDSDYTITPTPWVILANGNDSGSGFKCEWATVKDGDLYVGGVGSTWKTKGGLNNNTKYVKRVTARGEVTHLNWEKNYDKLASALGIHYPGFVSNEAGGWSPIYKKWLFLPRFINNEEYTDERASESGSNVALWADEYFDNVEVKHVGEIRPTRGFSSFKWVPGTNDEVVVALKSLEHGGVTETFIMAFDHKGTILMPETKVSHDKFEGIEFI